MLANALLTTGGELARSYFGDISNPDTTISLLDPNVALGRWSRAVRAQLYTFELVSGLTFSGTPPGPATLAAGGWPGITLQRPSYETGTQPGNLEAALQGVLDMAALRADRLNEILTQVAVPYSFFAMLLNLQPGRHRRTYELMATALILSGIAVMKFKQHFRVRRPADHSPLIQPVILTPSHGSYPAGHSTQGNILVKVLTALVDSKLGSNTAFQLQRLADRISANRVVAGVHFEEDMSAGAALGQELGTRFLNLARTTTTPTTALQWLWTQAAAEWA